MTHMALPPCPTALIAEDEPLLAAALQAELARAWPELQVLACVGDGASAVRQALQQPPDVLFFDIRMPGMSGLEAAAELADTWNTQQRPFPALVFVTAYDTHAVQAFEAQAIDYLLKPVQPERLKKTVEKVRLALTRRALPATPIDSPAIMGDAPLEATLAQLRQLLASAGGPAAVAVAPLKLIQASVGNRIQLVPIDEVVYFEAADKYLRVLTAQREYLIRTPLKDLLPQLDASVFWQIHRATVVNAHCIDSVSRDEAGKILLSLRGLPERLTVSRLYAHQFKAM